MNVTVLTEYRGYEIVTDIDEPERNGYRHEEGAPIHWIHGTAWYSKAAIDEILQP